LKSDKNNGYFLPEFFLEWEMFHQTEVAKKIKTYSLCSKKFILENLSVYSIMYNNTLEPGMSQIIKYGEFALHDE